MKAVTRLFKNTSKPIMALLICSGALVAVLLLMALYIGIVLGNTHFYDGIIIGDVAVGGMTTKEATAAITERYSPALSKTVTLRSEDAEQVVSLPELGATMNWEQTVSNAYNVGRSGGLFNRIKTIYFIKKENYQVYPEIICNESMLKDAIAAIAASVDQPGQETEIVIDETALTIKKGIPSYCIDQEAALKTFKQLVLTLSDDVFLIERAETLPRVPVASDLYEEFCGEPVDATYKVENQRIIITDDKPGINFDPIEAQTLIDQSTGNIITIPIKVTPAAVTKEQLNASLFSDLLGSYSSRYNTGDIARSHNVRLAAQKINEVVLAPGDVFSYNDTVGPRTTSHGFRVANVYVGNKIEPGIGGGICQVSSTLFNAVVLSDLEIIKRVNHSLPVSYVPLGRDATVSYGSIDFLFANSTENPIKIVASATNGVNNVAIYGIKANKNRTIEIATECIATKAAPLVQKENPDLPAGTIEVEQKGAIGSTYNTYKIIKENGQRVKTEFLTKSTYVPTERIEIIGTGPLPSSEPTTTEPTSEPIVDQPQQTESPATPSPSTDAIPTETPHAENSAFSNMVSNPAA